MRYLFSFFLHDNCDEFNELLVATEWDEDGEPTEFDDTFYDLPLEKQLELCIEVNDEAEASHTTFTVIGGDI